MIYSHSYIDILENDVNEISRTFVTDYWFDDDNNNNNNNDEKDIGDILNSNEWEAVPESKNKNNSKIFFLSLYKQVIFLINNMIMIIVIHHLQHHQLNKIHQ